MAMTITEEQLEAACAACYEHSFRCKYADRDKRHDGERMEAMRAALATLGIEVEKPDALKEVREAIRGALQGMDIADYGPKVSSILDAVTPYLKEKP